MFEDYLNAFMSFIPEKYFSPSFYFFKYSLQVVFLITQAWLSAILRKIFLS